MSLFSVCLHFLRCQGSCEKKSGYCKMCSGVRENTFYDYIAFLSSKVSRMDNYLDISSCTDHQVISFAQDLFAAICSVLVRTDHFSEIMSDLSLADEKKVVKKIFSGASLLLYKFFWS